MGEPRIGYVVKRFPRVSETFIAQEILELEQRGLEVRVLQLAECDRPAAHGWLGSIRAAVTRVSPAPFAGAWNELARRAREGGEGSAGAARAVAHALAHPAGRGRRYLTEGLAVARLVERHGLAHLHAHFANRPAFVALLAGAIAGTPFSFTAHAKDIYRDTNHAGYWRTLLAHAAFAVTVTADNVRFLRGLAGPELEARIRLLHNGVDLQALQPGPEREVPARPVVACVARLVEKKGVDVLIDALRAAVGHGTDVECVIAGDGEARAALAARVADAGLDSRVRFLGALPHEQIVALLRSADLFVLPCRVTADGDRDALPTVLIEAMACGLPCISTPVGGVGEIVDHGATGLLVPPDDAAALAAAIVRLAGDGELRRRLGRAGRARAEARFDRRRAGDALERWLREAASPPGVAVPRRAAARGAP